MPRKKEKSVHLTVTWGEPLKNFQQRHFYVTKSRIDPQNREDMNCDSAAQARRCAIAHARKVKGKVEQTTVETLEDFTGSKNAV